MAMPHWRNAKLVDLVSGLLFIGWLVLGIAGSVWQIAPECRDLARSFHTAAAITTLSQMTVTVFLGLQLVLVVIRHLPERKAPGVLPRAAAVIGASTPAAFLFLPRATLSVPMQIFSASLVIAGAVASTYVGGWLGRSFSVFPQARQLVTRGPYRFIRHPLYVAEQIATFGVMLQFAQPWSIVVALASVATQFPRMHYEEQVLSEAYPSYRDYAARTARLIPHVY
jgi:protein-S-isoprenylcysteine O-methyltransferase Ste14